VVAARDVPQPPGVGDDLPVRQLLNDVLILGDEII
jgi:hypothetical protein